MRHAKAVAEPPYDSPSLTTDINAGIKNVLMQAIHHVEVLASGRIVNAQLVLHDHHRVMELRGAVLHGLRHVEVPSKHGREMRQSPVQFTHALRAGPYPAR